MEETVYNTKSGIRDIKGVVLDILKNFHAARDLGQRIFIRDIKASYREFFLGFFWILSKPLGAAMTFGFLENQNIIQIPQDIGMPYPLYVMIAMTFWSLFVDSINTSKGVLNGALSLMSKAKFAIEAVFYSGILKLLYNFGLQIAVILIACLILGIKFTAALLYLPLIVVSIIISGAAIGMIIMPFVSLIKDLGQVVNTLVGLWLFITPVIYPPQTKGLAGFFTQHNPMSPIMVTAKEAFAGAGFSMVPEVIMYTCIFVVLFITGMILQRLALPILIERMN